MSCYIAVLLSFISGILCGAAIAAGVIYKLAVKVKEYNFERGRNQGWSDGWEDHKIAAGERIER